MARSQTAKLSTAQQDVRPLEFEIGSGSVIKGFDDGVSGMKVGEKRRSISLLTKLTDHGAKIC